MASSPRRMQDHSRRRPTIGSAGTETPRYRCSEGPRSDVVRATTTAMDIVIRPLQEPELDEADRIFRDAFGTFVGLPEPQSFGGDTDYVRTRWRANRQATFAAVRGGALLGSNFATRWGSFGFFGPLSVRPDLWDQGVARRLLDATMERFATWRLTHAGLFTFANSPKHV